jgi:ribosome maturation factor RimP
MSEMFDMEVIRQCVQTVLENFNCRLYDIRANEVSRVLTVYIDREGSSVTVGDCKKVSTELARMIDESEAVIGQFTLEVSSPGVARTLKRPEHYRWAIGKLVELDVGSEKIRGYVRNTKEDGVVVATRHGEDFFEYKRIVKAKVVEELHYDKR